MILYNAILSYTTLYDALAIVAQLVEQRIRNAWVAGSSPASGSKQKRHPLWVSFFVLPSVTDENRKGVPETLVAFWGGAMVSCSEPTCAASQ